MNILAMFSHPDDIESMCGGTLLKYKKQGHKIFFGLATSGDQGSNECASREEIGGIREKEQLEAAKFFDAEVRFLRFHDQRWFDTEEGRIAVLDTMRWADPDVIITNWPNDPSVDHHITGQMVADLLLSLPGKLLPAGEAPIQKVPSLFFADNNVAEFIPEVYVDISEEIEEKIQALACHVSQFEWMRRIGSLKDFELGKMPRIVNAFRGLQVGCEYAEGYRAHRIHGYMPNFKLLP